MHIRVLHNFLKKSLGALWIFLPTYHNYCLCGIPWKLLNFVPSRSLMGLTLSQQQYIRLFTVLDYFPNVRLNQSSFLWSEGHVFKSPNIMLVYVDFNCDCLCSVFVQICFSGILFFHNFSLCFHPCFSVMLIFMS